MRYISHRGNLNGKSDKENHPDQIKYCLDHGFNVEIDLWYIDEDFYLGHDAPQYNVEFEFIAQDNLWLHCKNIEALNQIKHYAVNCFSIDKDDFVVTTAGFIWLSPTYKKAYKDAICVMPEDPRWTFASEHLLDFAGICSDNIYYYKDYVNSLRR